MHISLFSVYIFSLSSTPAFIQHSFTMIHVRINRHDPASVEIYVNMSERSSPSLTSKAESSEHIYDRLFDRRPSIRSAQTINTTATIKPDPLHRKHYTLEQILANVETIQDQYEKVLKNRQSSSTLTCLSTWKQWRKSFKHRRRAMKSSSSSSSSYLEDTEDQCSTSTSPFLFGGETFQWIALPREHSDSEHIYENAILS